jgi:hypothetical protein
MKKIMTIIGLAGMICLFPNCKKSAAAPEHVNGPMSPQKLVKQDSAKLYVLLNSKPCSTPQNQYTSATLDIRHISVFNTETGWEELTPVAGAWDLVSLQSAAVPVADITEKSSVSTGTLTQIKLTFGDNNKLVVNNQAAPCYNLSTREVVLDMKGQLNVNTLNQIVISVDICGNITVEQPYNEGPCYTLHPMLAFESLTQMSTDINTPVSTK